VTRDSGRSLVDCHVHLAAVPEEDNGCYISPKMLRSPLFRLLMWKQALDPTRPREANRKYVDDVLTELRASRHVRQAVLLGMDGVYDQAGRLDREHTEFLIGNDYVLATVRTHPDEFLAGVSINPMRRDAIDEVHRCADLGAALVKVLPNAQQFDPAEARHKAFYRALFERKLPLLSHVGYEFSLIGRDQSMGDPNRLRVPLDEGTTVIAAHACSYGLMFREKFLPTLRELAGRYRGFYADVSALTLPNRFRMLLHLRKHPDLHSRLLFGTDYPLPVFSFPAWGRGVPRSRNRFDRQAQVCRALGVGVGSLGDVLPRAVA
jgi:uncharacterized protein